VTRQNARPDEQQIRQAVQIFEHVGCNVLAPRQRPAAPLGSAAHRARHVTGGRRRAAAGQNKILERRQVLVELIEFVLEARDVRRLDHAMPGDAQFAAQVEQIVLHLGETAGDRLGQARDAQHHADCAVRLVDRAIGFDPQVLLRYARTVAKAGAAVIAGAGVDLAEAVAHAFLLVRMRRYHKVC
jgi:hypothetical protein